MSGAEVGVKPAPSLKRRIAHAMEGAGLRGVLAKLGSSAAQRASGSDVGLLFDEIWVRRIGDVYFGDKARFDYYLQEFRGWNKQHKIWLENPKEYWFYKYNPAPGDVIIDVGAGFGNDALIFSHAVGDKGRVVSVEAHPAAFKKLEKTCKWSRLDNVTPLAVALGAEVGELYITGDDDDPENTVVAEQPAGEAAFKVPVRPFDDLAAELGIGRIDLIKMNIEGAETDALRGMSRCLANCANVIISCHDFRADRGEGEFYRTLEDVRAILTGAGFSLERRENDPRPYIRDTLYGWRNR